MQYRFTLLATQTVGSSQTDCVVRSATVSGTTRPGPYDRLPKVNEESVVLRPVSAGRTLGDTQAIRQADSRCQPALPYVVCL